MQLLNRSSRFGEYAYTDVSVGFFEKAREKFDFAEKHMRFAKLDLEVDPELQGFEKGTYDVIMYVGLPFCCQIPICAPCQKAQSSLTCRFDTCAYN